jgi:drug/metabolite transporter (DMT)-like permease
MIGELSERRKAARSEREPFAIGLALDARVDERSAPAGIDVSDETIALGTLEQPGKTKRIDLGSTLNVSAVSAIAIWSATAPFSKFALEQFPVLAYIVLRPIISIIILAGILVVSRQSLRIERADMPRVIITGVVGIAFSQLAYTAALDRTSVAHTVIIASISPLLVAAYRLVIKRQSLPGRSLFGLLGGFAGVVVLMLGAGGSSGTSISGDLLALVSAVTWMGATMWPVKQIQKYGAIRTNAWMFASSLLATVPFGIWELPSVARDVPEPLAWGALIYAATGGMVVGHFLWQRAVQQLGGARALVYLYLQPVGAMVLAALVLDERLNLIQAAGGAVALIGVALVRRD